jgi:2-haloacid dehalogenase
VLAPTGRVPDRAVLFDLGGVLIGWDPARPYAQVLPAAEVPAFMAAIDFPAWNRRHDAGLPFAAGEQELLDRFPDQGAAIRAYRQHFAHALTGLVPGTAAVVAELQQARVALAALTNWSAETFPVARERFGLLRRFAGVLVSGEEGVAKPDPAVFALALARFGFAPDQTTFVDDSAVNVAAARAAGLAAVQFVDAVQLRADLVALGLLGPRRAVTEPVYHLTELRVWRQAQAEGRYPWSGRRGSYESEGFVHAGFAHQLRSTRERRYADLHDQALVVLELDPARLSVPVVVEDLGAGPYPHLYGPLPVDEVVAEHALTAVAP